MNELLVLYIYMCEHEFNFVCLYVRVEVKLFLVRRAPIIFSFATMITGTSRIITTAHISWLFGITTLILW